MTLAALVLTLAAAFQDPAAPPAQDPPRPAPAAAAADAPAEPAKKRAADFAIAEFTVLDGKKAGASDDYVASLKASLGKRLAERKNPEGLPKGRLEIRLEKVVVVGTFKRGMLGVLAPPDLFAATVRVLDDQDHEADVVKIPETRMMASTVGTNWDKMLGIEGAILVYKKLYPEK